MINHKKILLVLAVLAAATVLFSKCVQPTQATDPRGKAYAGAATCVQCHKSVYDSFLGTAHFKATSLAGKESMLGHFAAGKNEFVYDSSTKIILQKTPDSFYQVLVEQGKEQRAYRYDIVFGVNHAQTGLYWNDGRLYELPVSFYTESNVWGTSPGFPLHKPVFNRLVNTDCLDCHSSNISIKNGAVDADPQYDPKSLITGIDCERCHGPALNHVNYHVENPAEKNAKYIIRNAMLSQQQKMDACALCHSGNDKMKIQSRFNFNMGDTLGYFFMPFGGTKPSGDVHGNQSNLLVQSKCFNINTITCGTCHSAHANAGQQSLSVYSQKCMNCHQPGSSRFCPQYKSIGEAIKTNCIDCHMPKQPSNAISFQQQQDETHSLYFLRTHRIAVYADSLKNIHRK